MVAYDKIKMVPKGQGVVVYGVLRPWFTDVSNLGSAEQARMLMHPAPPKREEGLAEHAEMGQDKMRHLEAPGDQLKQAPVFPINALRVVGGRWGQRGSGEVVRGAADQGQGVLEEERAG